MLGQRQKTTQNRNTLETTSSQKERKILLVEEKDKEELRWVQMPSTAPRNRINLQDNCVQGTYTVGCGAAINGSAEGQERDNGLYSRYWEKVQLKGKQTRWVWCLTTVITALCRGEESSKLRSLRPSWPQ